MEWTLGRAIIKKLAVKFEGNEILSVHDFDVFACYRDLRKTDSEKRDAVRKGIIHSKGCTSTCTKSCINAKGKGSPTNEDEAIATAYEMKC